MAESLVIALKSLKLHGLAQAVAELAAQQSPAFKQAERILGDLIKAEVAEREVRSIQYQLKSARFPAYRDLAGFRFEHSAVDVALVKTLHACEFIEQALGVITATAQQQTCCLAFVRQHLLGKDQFTTTRQRVRRTRRRGGVLWLY